MVVAKKKRNPEAVPEDSETPRKVKKECAEESPQGSPAGGSQGSPAGGSQTYVNEILQKVDEINSGGLSILEWLTTEILAWPEGKPSLRTVHSNTARRPH
jgi:hypothetical protein